MFPSALLLTFCLFVLSFKFYLFWASLSLSLLCKAFLQLQRAGAALVVICGLLTVVASLVTEHRLWSTQASVVAVLGLQSISPVVLVHGLSCSVACGIFPDQALNPCLLHQQEAPLPLSHPGSSSFVDIRSTQHCLSEQYHLLCLTL